MTPALVLHERDGTVATITLNRPPLNILSIAMLKEFRETLADAIRSGARVVRVRGAGKGFSVGVDVKDHTRDRVPEMLDAFHGALLDLLSCERPTVAAVHGPCLGGGFELALAADVVLLADTATVGLPEVQVGVLPPFASAYLPRLVGYHRAAEAILSGRAFTANEAVVRGFGTAVVPESSLEAESRAACEQLAALSSPVIRFAKQALRLGRDLPFREALREVERLYAHDLMATEDASEGLAAFLEKRKPVWRDR